MVVLELLAAAEQARKTENFPPALTRKEVLDSSYELEDSLINLRTYTNMTNYINYINEERAIEIPKFELAPGFVIAGGACLSNLQSAYRTRVVTNINDIDIFYYNPVKLSVRELFANVIDQIRLMEKHNIVYNIMLYEGVLSFDWNYIKVQIILRQYNSIEHIINSFDLCASQIAYDGLRYYATSLFAYTYKTGCQPIDSTRRSPSFAYRIIKYWREKKIGITIPIPNTGVMPRIFNNEFVIHDNGYIYLSDDNVTSDYVMYDEYRITYKLASQILYANSGLCFDRPFCDIAVPNIVRPLLFTTVDDFVIFVYVGEYDYKEMQKRLQDKNEKSMIVKFNNIYSLKKCRGFSDAMHYAALGVMLNNDDERIDEFNQNIRKLMNNVVIDIWRKLNMSLESYWVKNVGDQFTASREPTGMPWDQYFIRE